MTTDEQEYFRGQALKIKKGGYIDFSIKKNNTGLFLSIEGNEQTGNPGHPQPIYLHKLLERIRTACGDRGWFKVSDLTSPPTNSPIINEDAAPGQQNRNRDVPAFVVAVLMDIGFVVPASRKNTYRFRKGKRVCIDDDDAGRRKVS